MEDVWLLTLIAAVPTTLKNNVTGWSFEAFLCAIVGDVGVTETRMTSIVFRWVETIPIR